MAGAESLERGDLWSVHRIVRTLRISYLYFPPVTYADVNAGVKYDEGFATPIPVLLQQQYPTRYKVTVGVLMILGVAALVYGLFELGAFIVEAASD